MILIDKIIENLIKYLTIIALILDIWQKLKNKDK